MEISLLAIAREIKLTLKAVIFFKGQLKTFIRKP